MASHNALACFALACVAREAYIAHMKRVPVFYLVAAVTPVWGRFEDELGADGPGQLADLNLPLYMLAGVVLWAALVWDRGWRWRAWPLAYLAAMAGMLWWRGLDGLGMLLMGSCVAIFPLMMWQPWRKKVDK